MQDVLGQALKKLKRKRIRRMRMLAVLLVLSLVVSLDVFWSLRQPGLTLAGNADCGITEHTHDELCQNEETTCQLTEHVHTVECYSDETADIESQLDWQKMFEQYPFTGNLSEDLVGVAKTQVGYSESNLNFQVDQDGVRHGYTRYGAWYGTPYSDWSATFVSFCLHFAGASADEFPTNTGANSMAEQWELLGKYVAVGNYIPVEGDLIFFKDNTVGIVIETFSTAVYVVRGDIEGSVQTSLVSIADNSISGWGQTGKQLSEIDLLDISNDPAVHVLDSGSVALQQSAIINSLQNAETKTTPIDLISYLHKTGGSYYITLLDMYDHEVPKDHHGNYTVYSDENYRITLSSSAPNGFENGTYIYQVPTGANIEGESGIFELEDGTVVGSWEISDTGLMTLYLDNVNDLSDVIISATMGIHFPAQEEPIDFDGKVTVTVLEKHEEVLDTQIVKWGEQGCPDNALVPGKTHKIDPDKIYWTVEIIGNKNSAIPGSTLTDRVVKHYWSQDHYYSESDIAAGITFGVSGTTENSTEWNWHKWTVYPDDPNLVEWNEDGWSYIMPETITCSICGGTLILGNEGFTYYAEYTTTPVDIDIAGSLEYVNEVSVDNQETEGWAAHTQTHVNTTITKNGTFVSDANGGKFIWEMQATIPASKLNEDHTYEVEYMWSIVDEMCILDQNGQIVGGVFNTLDKATVTANYYGTTINVPYAPHATEDDPYAFAVWSWKSDYAEGNNVNQLIFLKRCECDERPCGRNGNDWRDYEPTRAYCDCWNEYEDTTFTITYETTDMSIINAHNSQNRSVLNKARLSNGDGDAIDTAAWVPIPNILEKEWIEATKDYIVKYQITVNESKIVLGDGSPITIRDEMTETISFIRGTLVVSAVDIDGNRTVLQEGVDYEYRYNVDLDDNGHEDEGHAHVLEIDILHPKPVTYYLDYDTTVVVQAGAGTVPVIKYQNEASISLWNKKVEITDETTEKTYTNVTLASKRFGIEINKKAAETNSPLPNAKFGLFDEQGHLIIARETDENGNILFATDVANGIVLKEHLLYYIQELEAPSGYRLSDKQYWFVFCASPDGLCDAFKEVTAGTNAVRVPINTISEIEITNDLLTYDLPSTGGIGIHPLLLASAICIIVPLVYRFIRRRKRGRRGVG